jgi:hypothetical protein
MSRTLELYCLVVEDEPSSLFPVKIESTESVGTLKDLIWLKKQERFKGVDADTLVLWKVSIPDDDGLQQGIEELNLIEEQSLRQPAARLSKIFSDPVEDEHVHILVRPPPARECSSLWLSVSYTQDLRQIPPSIASLAPVSPTLELNCLVLGDDPSHVFTIEIGGTKNVSVLKKAIKNEKKNVFQHVDADALVLWKVSMAVDHSFEENVKKVELRDEEALSPVEELSDVFSEVPARRHLHIIVSCPPNGE